MDKMIGNIPIPICPCYCRLVLALLVIVFAWVNVGYNQYLHTVLGLILMLLALTPVCCCKLPKKAPAKKVPAKKEE